MNEQTTVAVRPYITSAEIAELVGVTVATVQRWAKQGLMPPPLRIGGSGMTHRWHRETIERWLKESAAPPATLTAG
jgi:excisionase family DNA binding protein